MAVIQPTLNNFQYGVIDKTFSGRTDLAFALKSAYSLRNGKITASGSVRRRGGLRHNAYWVDGKKYALLKWSYNNEIDLLIVVSENSIRFMVIKNGAVTGFFEQDGSTLDITSYSISEESLDYIDYACNLETMIIVSSYFKPIQIKITIDSSDSYSITHSYFNIMGVQLTLDAITSGDANGDLTRSTIQSLMIGAGLNDGSQHATTGSFKYLGTTYTPTNISLSVTNSSFSITNEWVGGQATNIDWSNNSYKIPAKMVVYKEMNKASEAWDILNPDDMKCDGYVTEFAIDTPLSTIKTYFNNLDRGTYTFFLNSSGYNRFENVVDLMNRMIIVKVITTPYSSTLTLYYGSGSSLVITDDTEISGYLTIENGDDDIVINGYSRSSSEILNEIGSFIDIDETYYCSSYSGISGSYPTSVKKCLIGGYQTLLLNCGSGNYIYINQNEDSYYNGDLTVDLTPMKYESVFPSAVCFSSGRLVLGSRNSVYMSKVNDYQNFAYFEEIEYTETKLTNALEWDNPDTPEYSTTTEKTRQIGAASAIRLRLNTDENESINWIVDLDNIYIGTSTSEWAVPAGFDGTNVRCQLLSRYGSSRIKPRFFGKRMLYVSSSRRRILALTPGASTPAIDVSEHAASLFDSDIVSMDFRQDPSQEIYVVMSDGKVIMGREVDDLVYAWQEIVVPEYSGDKVVGVAIVQSGDEDAVFFGTMRYNDTNATTYSCIEKLLTVDDSTFDGRSYLDGSEYVGTPGNTVPDMVRFTNLTYVYARFLTESGEIAGRLVMSGINASTYYPDGSEVAVAIPSYLEAHFGLRTDFEFETCKIDTPETDCMLKSVGKAAVRVYNSGMVDVDGDTLVLPAEGEYPFTGVIPFEHSSYCGYDYTMKFESDLDIPFEVQTIRTTLSIGDTL